MYAREEGKGARMPRGHKKRKKKRDPRRTRTSNLGFRRPAPYPIGPWGQSTRATPKYSGICMTFAQLLASLKSWSVQFWAPSDGVCNFLQGKMVLLGLEPRTFRLLAERSDQLSYKTSGSSRMRCHVVLFCVVTKKAAKFFAALNTLPAIVVCRGAPTQC